MTVGSDGRPSGEAYLQLPSNEHVQEALKKDRGTMGNRYIEGTSISLRHYKSLVPLLPPNCLTVVFAITNDELQLFLKRLEVKRSLSDKGFIRVRGLPYNCKREELDAFFKGASTMFTCTTLMITALLSPLSPIVHLYAHLRYGPFQEPLLPPSIYLQTLSTPLNAAGY